MFDLAGCGGGLGNVNNLVGQRQLDELSYTNVQNVLRRCTVALTKHALRKAVAKYFSASQLDSQLYYLQIQ